MEITESSLGAVVLVNHFCFIAQTAGMWAAQVSSVRDARKEEETNGRVKRVKSGI